MPYRNSQEIKQLQEQALFELQDRIIRIRQTAAFLPEDKPEDEEL